MAELVDASSLRVDGDSRVGSSPTAPTKQQVLNLYPEFHEVYGPYLRSDGRRVVIMYDGVKRSSRQYAKVVLEVKLGRRLVGDETVDHEDEDKTNDEPGNLRVLPSAINSSLGASRPKQYAECATCTTTFELTRDQRTSRNKDKKKFCSRECLRSFLKT